jgi:hypothetical protein
VWHRHQRSAADQSRNGASQERRSMRGLYSRRPRNSENRAAESRNGDISGLAHARFAGLTVHRGEVLIYRLPRAASTAACLDKVRKFRTPLWSRPTIPSSRRRGLSSRSGEYPDISPSKSEVKLHIWVLELAKGGDVVHSVLTKCRQKRTTSRLWCVKNQSGRDPAITARQNWPIDSRSLGVVGRNRSS